MTALPLLTTKLSRPAAPARRVCRERLLELIDRGAERPLTLVSAAAGSGKSTLLVDWIERRGHRVAWLSLDEGDNDLSRFLTYLIAALRSLHRALGEEAMAMLRGPQPPELEPWVTDVVNTVHRAAAEDGEPLRLVLDDYHLITSDEIHRVMEGLVEGTAGALRLIVATRADPPWALARMRVRGQLVEVGGADLSFNNAEAIDFLNDTMALELAPRLVGVLEERTEGWIAGLQLAALSLKGRGGGRSGDAASFIEQFTGGHRFIFDYLSEEVLGLQPRETLTFLLSTAVLERLSGELCDAVLDRDDSQQLLEELEQSNLFLIALDDERRWYRYHHLFARVLRRQLEQRRPAEETAELHRRASDWYAANDLIEDALRHAIAAADAARAEGLILSRAPKLFMDGDAGTLLRWLESLPETWLEQHPATLGISHIWALMLGLRWREGHSWLQRLEGPLAAAGIPAIDAQLAGLRGLMARGQGDVDTAIELYHQVLRVDGDDTLFVRGTTSFDLGVIYLAIDDLKTAEQMFNESWRLNRAAGHELFTVWSRFYLAEIQAARGALREALELCRQAVDEEGGETAEPRAVLSLPYAGMADVHREWNELETAHRLAMRAVEQARRGGLPAGLLTAYTILAKIESARGAFADALAVLDTADQLARRLAVPGMEDLLMGHRARILLCQARSEGRKPELSTVQAWLRERDLLNPQMGLRSTFLPAEHYDNAILAQIRLRLERGESARCLELLQGLEETARRAGRNRARIEIRILCALAHHQQNDHDAALKALREAFELAATGGFVRLFVDEGAALGELIGKALEQTEGLSVDHAERLRRALRPPGNLDVTAKIPPHEALSERELEVLRVVATGASNQETGRRLFISPATVKKHLENIYGKLSVRNRMEAVAKARELGQLEASESDS